MGTENDGVVIDVEVALAKADRDFEAFKKKLETPISLNVSGPGAGATQGGRTFSGQPVTTGPANFATPGSVQPHATSIQTQMEQGISLRSSTAGLGGTGIFGSAGPVPTAGTNTVYGSISAGVPMVTQAQAQAAKSQVSHAALDAVRASLSAGETLDTTAPAIPSRQAKLESMLGDVRLQMSDAKGIERTVLARQAGHLMDELGYAPLTAPERATRQHSNPRAARLSTSDIVEDAPGFFSAKRGLAFDRATSAAAIVTSGVAFADQIVGANQAERDTNRFDSVADAAEKAYQQQRGTLGITRSFGGFLNYVFNDDYFVSDRTVEESKDNANRARGDANRPGLNRALDAYISETNTIGMEGTALGRAKARAQYGAEIGELEASLKDPANVNKGETEKKIEAVRDRERKTIRDLDRIDNDAARVTRLGNALSSNASSAALRGNDLQSELLGISAKFDPQIEEIERKIARLPKGDSMWEPLTENRNTLEQQRSGAQQQARTSYTQGMIGSVGTLYASSAILNYRPFDAQRAEVEAQFKAATTTVDANGNVQTVDEGSDRFQIAKKQRDLSISSINQNQAFQTRNINTSLDAQDQATSYGFLRNALGTESVLFAGQTINQMRDLARGGNQTEAQKLRANALRQLDLSAFEYKGDFRAGEFDAQNNLLNPRDVEDFAGALASVADAQKQIKDADPNADRVEGGDAGLDSLADKIIKGLGEEFRNALRDAASEN